MDLTMKIATGIFAAIVIGLVVANSAQFNLVTQGIGTATTGVTNSLIGIKPIAGAQS